MKQVVYLLILALCLTVAGMAQEHSAAPTQATGSAPAAAQTAPASAQGEATQPAAAEPAAQPPAESHTEPAAAHAEAQPGAPPHGEAASHGEGGHGSNLDNWKWANFAILAGLIGFAIYKKGGAFFLGRTKEIQKGLVDAAQVKKEAEARYAEIEARLANLGSEIEALKQQARDESAAEGERVRQETARDLAKVQQQSEQEIAAAAKAAQQELRAHAAELAVQLAEQKIRQQLTPGLDASLIGSMAADLERRSQEARVQ